MNFMIEPVAELPALLRRYDGILVLKNGEIAEFGRFDALMEKKGYGSAAVMLAAPVSLCVKPGCGTRNVGRTLIGVPFTQAGVLPLAKRKRRSHCKNTPSNAVRPYNHAVVGASFYRCVWG